MDNTLPPVETSGRPPAGVGVLAQIWRRRYLFGAMFAAGLIPILAVLLLVRPIYFADGSVIIGEQEPSISGASPAWIQKLGDPADLESQLLIIRSHRMLRLALARPGVIDAIRRECKLVGNPFKAGCDQLVPETQELIEHVEGRYTIRAVGRSRVISIGYQSRLPDIAFMMANALIVTYLEDQRAENSRSREESAGWVLHEAKQMKGPANGVDDAFAQARQNFMVELHRKARDLETERRSLVSSARLVSLAEVPKLPFFPKRLPLLAAGLTFAGLLALFVTFRRNQTDDTVRRPHALPALARAPLLTVLPWVQHPSLRPRVLRALPNRDANPDSTMMHPAIAGPMIALYGRLALAGDTGKHRTFLVASAGRAEGKTLTAVALARAAAGFGRRTLLVDCNLRHPSVARLTGIDPSIGLVELLRGDVELRQAIVATAHPGLDAIAAGTVVDDPAKLLMHDRLLTLSEGWKDYDFVVLDGPDAASMSDIIRLGRQTDGVIWCVRWGSTLQADVQAALDDIRNAAVHVSGIVVDFVDTRELPLYERSRITKPRAVEAV